ncbi:hypothetical protein EMCG_05545 [[Emmonsia] crescens]|uniref:Uncharacterized protein n=1 Tax=[Emmonsia] crescens TaxID=73230 RepID=A0A0G2HPH4_9EURO|nr:hypothetical protein EMCG_05545 [Emmonsia crescens UAMH 3008]
MHIAKPFAFLFVNVATANAVGCGDAQACIGTETCITVTRTAPSTTTITTCAPTPTCLYRAVHPEVVPDIAALATVRLPNVDRQIPSGQIARRTWGIVNVIRNAATTTSVWITFAASRDFRLGCRPLDEVNGIGTYGVVEN